MSGCTRGDQAVVGEPTRVPGASEVVSVETAVGGIAAQQQNVAEIFGELDSACTIFMPTPWCGYFSSSNKTFASYSIVASQNNLSCTGWFIGPNLFVTAGHCGASATAGLTSIVYRGTSRSAPPGQGATTRSAWTLYPPVVPPAPQPSCKLLMSSLQQDETALYRGGVDILVYGCSNVTGPHGSIAPGLLLGSLDFDIRDANVGETVYRLWVNPVFASPYNGADHLLISRATNAAGAFTTITSNTEHFGYQHALAYTDSTCANKGSSGSPGLSESWNRTLQAPLSDAGPNPDQPCAIGTKSVKATALFTEWYQDPRWALQLNTSYLESLGLLPQHYWGYQDKDHNEVLDIQEDFQLKVGEIDRAYYFYNFDSAQQNAFWRTQAFSNIFKNQVTPQGIPYGIAHIQTDTNASPVGAEGKFSETLLRHDTFPLQASTTYRVNMRLEVFSASGPNALQFRAGATNASVVTIPTPLGVTRPSFKFTTGPQACNLSSALGSCGIRFEAVNPTNAGALPLLSADLSNLSISKETARDVVIDFDTLDSRGSWRNQNTNSRGLILPDGISSVQNGPPDFAGVVVDDPARAQSVDWPLTNEHLDLTVGDSYTIFFRAKASSGTLTGNAEVFTSGGSVLATLPNWSATSSWGPELALGPFVAQSDSRVHFGPNSFATSPTGHILIDNIRIHRN